ncbi:MAG: hypothetical protein LBB38_02010, partial [Puniceicoccales bacterium]|nr:hypothetical protein [Puniceicoccales bacterium]
MGELPAVQRSTHPLVLSLGETFKDVFSSSERHIDGDAIRAMIAVSDSFNGDDVYAYDSAIATKDGMRSSHYENDGSNFVLYSRDVGSLQYVKVCTINDKYFDSSELYLKSTDTSLDESKRYVSIYDLVKLDAKKILEKSAPVSYGPLSPYSDLAFRVAAVAYSVSCIQLRMAMIRMRDIAVCNAEIEKINSICKWLNALKYELTKFDSQIADSATGGVSNMHAASVSKRVMMFLAERKLLDETSLAGTSSGDAARSIVEHYKTLVESLDDNAVQPSAEKDFIAELFMSWSNFSALLHHYGLFTGNDDAGVVRYPRVSAAHNVKRSADDAKKMLRSSLLNYILTQKNIFGRNMDPDYKVCGIIAEWNKFAEKALTVDDDDMGEIYKSYPREIVLRKIGGAFDGTDDNAKDLFFRTFSGTSAMNFSNTDGSLRAALDEINTCLRNVARWSDVDESKFIGCVSKLLTVILRYRTPAIVEIAQKSVSGPKGRMFIDGEIDSIAYNLIDSDGPTNFEDQRMAETIRRYMKGANNGFYYDGFPDRLDGINISMDPGNAAKIRIDGYNVGEGSLNIGFTPPGWHEALPQSMDGLADVCIPSHYDGAYWREVNDDSVPCSASAYLGAKRVRQFAFDPRLRANGANSANGTKTFIGVEGFPETNHGDSADCMYFDEFHKKHLTINGNSEDQYIIYESIPKDKGKEDAAPQYKQVSSHFDSSIAVPDYSVRIFTADYGETSPRSDRDFERMVAKTMCNAKWMQGGEEVGLLPPDCFNGTRDGFSDWFREMLTKIARNEEDENKPRFQLCFSKRTPHGGKNFMISKIEYGNDTHFNVRPTYDLSYDVEHVWVDPLTLKGSPDGILDFWPLPKAPENFTPGSDFTNSLSDAKDYLLDMSDAAVAAEVRLACPHINCWTDILRIYSDQVSSETSRLTSDMQRFINFCQQELATATNFLKSVS